MARICVTGGAGFIGSHLVDRLITEGHAVQVIDNLSTGSRKFVNEKADFIELDIRSPKLLDVMKVFQPDYVFHEAAQTMVDASMKDPAFDCDVNLMGLINVLNACLQTKVKKILMPSSAAVYGDLATLPLDESMQGVPSSFYGLTKLTTESYLRLYKENFGLSYICYRYANVYGPRQGDSGEGGVISIFLKRIMKGQMLYIFGSGKQTRDFVYVDDVVDANIKGLEQEDICGVYNVSTGCGTSVNQLVADLSLIHGKDLQVDKKPSRTGDIMHSRLSTDRAQRDLHYSSATALLDGLRKTYIYFEKEYK